MAGIINIKRRVRFTNKENLFVIRKIKNPERKIIPIVIGKRAAKNIPKARYIPAQPMQANILKKMINVKVLIFKES
ncbi:MAG: hypothetical protein KDK36_05715, partial [Leptospiraceae bacterium]|nr:hypothetical protein [Leptospiraceae bacterium]